MRHFPNPVLRLALFSDRVSLVSRRVFEGMARYASDHPHVQVAHWKTSSLHEDRVIKEAKLDGLLVETLIDHDHSVLPASTPALCISSVLKKSPIPRLCDDQEWAGTTAARYFMSRGFRQFAFCGYRFHHGSACRGQGFMRELAKAGHRCASHDLRSSRVQEISFNSATEQERLGRWLVKLPRPCAVFAFCDAVALLILQTARANGLLVPKDLAVLGVDNDPFLQNAMPLKLSSINLGTVQTGYDATACLVRWIQQGKKPAAETRLKSARVVVRETTDHHYVEDELVARAYETISETVRQNLRITDVASTVGCSVRTMQRRFQQHLNLSAKEVSQRTRLELAQKKLAETGAALKDIAAECGFASAQHLCAAFRRRLGLTPGEWRKSQFSRDGAV